MSESFRWSFGELRESDPARGSSGSRRTKPPSSAPAPVSASQAHEQLFGGRYRLEGELGRGGMGVVMRALDLHTNQPVALKLLTRGLDERRRARFAREGELAAAVVHPDLVRVFGGGVQGDQPFLVMELVDDARDLEDALEGLDLDAKLALLERVARAVGAAHRVGVVHRDLKFGNVLVDREGNPKVCDFGLAWRADLERLTKTGAMVGTPVFMSPEQTGVSSSQSAPPGPKTDVWALGVMLYHVLCGVFPFRSQTLITLVQEIHEEDPFPIRSKVGVEVSRELEAVCRRALAKRSDARFDDADAFAEALHDAAQPRPGGARRGVRVRVALLLIGGVGAGLAGVAAFNHRAGAELTPAPSPALASMLDGRVKLEEAQRLVAASAPAPELFARLEEALRLAEGEPELKAEVQLELTRAALERGHYARGLEPAAALREHPQHGREASFLRARMLGWLQRHGDAIAEYRGLAQEEDRWGLLAQGMLTVREGRETKSMARRLRERLPNDLFAAVIRNQVHVKAKDYDRALQVLEEVKTARPTVQLLVSLATARLVLRRGRKEARRLIEQATALASPREPLTLSAAWSQLLLQEGDPAGALVYMRRRALTLTNPQALLALGVELEQAGALSEARAVWRKGLTLGGAEQERRVRSLPMPIRLRMLRALELPFLRDPLGKEAQGWVAQQVAPLPEPMRETATRVLSRCVAGYAWRALKDDVAELRRRGQGSAEVALLEARVQISRDRVAPALAALARARALGASEDRVALEEAMATARASGLKGVKTKLTALAARDVPEGWVAGAILAWLSDDSARAIALAERARTHPRAPFAARAVYVLVLMSGQRAVDGVWASDPYFLESRCADPWMTAVRASALGAAMSGQTTTTVQRRALFWSLELAMSLSAHPLPRLDAAEEALHAGPKSPWYPSAEVWLREASESDYKLQEPLRGTMANRVRAVRGLLALMQGASATEVERHWRGLERGRHVYPRSVIEFRRRFGRTPTLAKPK